MGPAVIATPDATGTALGQITPSSPPGLPINVEVSAIPDSTGRKLKVTWEEGDTGGLPITFYEVQTRITNDTKWITANTLLSESFNNNVTYLQYVSVSIPYASYEVRVVAHNALGRSGPDWFSRVSPSDPLVDAIQTADNYLAGNYCLYFTELHLYLHFVCNH